MSVLVAAVEPPSFGTVLLVVAAVWLLPAVGVFAWVWADRVADGWLDRHGLIPDDDEPAAVVVPLTDSPGFDRITNLIAANEAARADWDEPASWGDPA